MLEEIAGLAISHRVDALVVAGDVFDHQNPSSSMYKMLYGFFDDLAERAPGISCVVIAGNHDSAARLEAPGPLLKRAGVRAVGSLCLQDGQIDLDHHLISIGRDGQIAGYVLAIPYLRPGDLPAFDIAANEQLSSPMAGAIRRLYKAAIGASRERIGKKPLVVTGHLHVKGAELSESLSERRIVIGNEEAVPADVFASGADYVALGHLHRPQDIAGKERRGEDNQGSKGGKGGNRGCIRYAGSPLLLSTAEQNYRHGVSLVEIKGSRCRVEHLQLKRQVPFLRIPAKNRLTLDKVEEALERLDLDKDLPEEQRPFVQIALQIEGPQPGFRGYLDEICTKFAIRDVAPDIEWPDRSLGSSRKAAEPRLLEELRPEDLFIAAFKEHFGTEPQEAELQCFRQLLNEVGA